MTDTKKVLVLAATILLTVILAVTIYCFGTRYQMIGTGDGTAYMVDRVTGKSWACKGKLKVEHEGKAQGAP